MMIVAIPDFDLDSSDEDFREWVEDQGVDYNGLLEEAGECFKDAVVSQ